MKKLMTLFLVLAVNGSLFAEMQRRGEALTADDKTTKGKSLYMFDPDTAGKSNCNKGCAKVWPPLAATKDTKVDAPFSVIKRDEKLPDGSDWFQIAYLNRPLYFYSGDAGPGETEGDGLQGIWHIAFGDLDQKIVSRVDTGFAIDNQFTAAREKLKSDGFLLVSRKWVRGTQGNVDASKLTLLGVEAWEKPKGDLTESSSILVKVEMSPLGASSGDKYSPAELK